MGRRNQNPRHDHNLEFRLTYIHEADRMMAECTTFRAACYAALGMQEDASRCRHNADSIPVFWDEDDFSSSENEGDKS